MARTRNSWVRCPLCGHGLDWADAPVVRLDRSGQEIAAEPAAPHDPVVVGADELHRYRVCAGGGSGRHYLPYRYAEYGSPIVVGVVGQASAGKTHLLAAMIGSLLNSAGLGALGLRADPLDLRVHRVFEEEKILPFLRDRRVLPVTRPPTVELTDALRIVQPATGAARAVVFFDVGGERLEADRDNHFLSALNALLFVVDGEALLDRPSAARTGDRTFRIVLDRLFQIHGYTAGGFLPLPASVVVAKADLLRYLRDPEIDRWFEQPGEEELDLGTVEQESADVFQLLAVHAPALCLPATACLRSSLHLASASGSGRTGDRFRRRGFGPRRTVKPLLWLLAQRGVVPPPPADREP
jgi:hypothetical protein